MCCFFIPYQKGGDVFIINFSSDFICIKNIKKVFYKDEPNINKKLLKEIKHADLIILSMGSLFTSIIPNLICDEIIDALDNSKAKIMYACNIMTQPGETDDFSVSDHIKLLNKYTEK